MSGDGFDGPVELVREHHPRLTDLVAGSPAAASFKLFDAQLTLARHYGYPSWPALCRHVELVNRLSRSPHQQPVGLPLADDAARADELLRLACPTTARTISVAGRKRRGSSMPTRVWQGLGAALSARIPVTGERLPLHDRGKVLVQSMDRSASPSCPASPGTPHPIIW